MEYGGPWLEASRRTSSITGGIEVDVEQVESVDER
jgi:hypothetical protein